MRDFEWIKKLIGEDITEEDLKYIDCYVRPHLGLFIPTTGPCGYASKHDHTHPSYMITILFDDCKEDQKHYRAEITSPQIAHNDRDDVHYYCLMIERDYFEERFKLYQEKLPLFNRKQFKLCTDILKSLNTFALEYDKQMMNAHITLDAQVELITHWIIRSIIGETLDMSAVSSDYSVARAQHYIKQHFMEQITVSKLAELGYVSPSCLNRRFKKEVGITPIEYLIQTRIENAKKLLRRKDVPITEIVMRCGFGSSAHFSTCFHQRTNLTPTEYQEKYKG